MELKEDTRPLTANFTAPVATRIVSDNGSMCMNFEAGQTRPVHRDMFAEAVRGGLVPEEPLDAPPPVPENKPQEVAVREGLVEACKMLIAKAVPTDFTLAGLPRAAAVKKLVNFDFTTNDVRLAFEEAMHEVEQDGDDSKEHTEPSSSTTE